MLDYLQPCLGSSLLLAWSVKVCQEWKLWAFSGLLCMRAILGMHVAFYSPWYSQELFRALISPSISFPSLFFSGFLVCLLLSPNVIPCPQQLWLIHLPLNAFSKHTVGSCLSSGVALRQTKQRQAFGLILQGAIRLGKTHNHNSLRLRSVLLPLVLATCPRNPGYCLHGRYQAGE